MKSIQTILASLLFLVALLGFIPPSLASPSANEREGLETRSEEAFLDLDASLDPIPESEDAPPRLDDSEQSNIGETESQRNSIDETTVVVEEQTQVDGHQGMPTQQELYQRLLLEEADARGYHHDQYADSNQDADDWEEAPRSQPAVVVVEERPRRRWFERQHYGLWHLLHHLNSHQHRANGHARTKHQRRAKRNFRRKRHVRAKRKAQRKARRAKRNHRRSSRARSERQRRRR